MKHLGNHGESHAGRQNDESLWHDLYNILPPMFFGALVDELETTDDTDADSNLILNEIDKDMLDIEEYGLD